MTDINDTLIEQAETVMNDEGAAPGNSIHSWRCEHPEQYGYCTCVADLARAVLAAVAPAIRAQALRDTADWLDDFRPFPGEETEALRERADQIEEGK